MVAEYNKDQLGHVWTGERSRWQQTMCEMFRTRERISNSVWLNSQDPEKQEYPKGVVSACLEIRDGGADMACCMSKLSSAAV